MPASILPSLKCRFCMTLNPPGSRFCNKCGNDLTFSMQPDGLLPAGAVLRGCYVIEGVIGEGGMGVVYSCHHKTLGTRYALKVLDPKLARMDVLRRRFLAEAKIQATVVHPHIVHVMDVIDSEKDGGIPGILAIVMEYVEGEALDQIIERSPLSERDAVSSTLVILDAIGFAHHAGIVHRDLKPSNIMVSRAEAQEALYCGVKVMDFGIAKLLEANEQKTVTGAKMGTPRYMAPEQIENARDVDERTDLYAIGLTLYELLCGRTPFEEFKEFELLKAQLSMKPPSMRTFRNDISDRLEAIVMKSLEKDRANRYPNAESFQRALLSLGGYDEIPLRLNPNDGVAVVLSSNKLKRKIERAIDRTKAKNAENEKEKPAQVKNGAGTQNDVSDVVKKVRRAQSPSLDISVQEENVKPSLNPHGRKSVKESSPEQQPGGKEGKRRSYTRISVSKEHLSETSLRAKRSKSAQIAAQKASIAAEKVPMPAEQPVKKSGQPAKKDKTRSGISREEEIPNKSVPVQAAVPVRTAESAAGREHLHASEPRSEFEESIGDVPEVQPKPIRKSSPALKIVIAAIMILAIFGLIYRSVHEMPAPTPQPADEANIAENVHKNELIQDVSSVPLVEKQTDTGMMTVVPRAEHWISTGNKQEIRRQALDAFAIDQVEVSHFQYGKCVEAEKCPPLAAVPLDLNLPVTDIGYGSAEAFCRFAGKQLPTSDQWEAAARFGGDTNGITNVNVSCETVHCGSELKGGCRKINPPEPESVFRRVAGSNPGHLLNMLGNVREWTATPGRDPQTRRIKGGGYRTPRSEINIGAWTEERVNGSAPDIGFRCVRPMP